MEYRIMSDKEVSEKKLSENNKTEQQEAATSSSGDKTNIDKSVKTSTSKSGTSTTKKTTASDSVAPAKANKRPIPAVKPAKPEKKSNKTAIFALTLASISVFASLGHYVWQQQQTSAQLLALSQQNQRAIEQSQQQLKNNVTAEFNRQLQQQNKLASQSQQNAKQAHRDSETQLQQLAAHIAQLEEKVSQRDPSDWLVHEAEYLVRIAARTMWLERDTKAAIGLLRDADNRLKELDQSKFLPVRALINQDIEALALMPTLENQEAILTLMALNNQIPTLSMAGVNLAEALDETKEDFSLSEDVGDWRENLNKTWQKFLKDFITVRRRTGMVEPLMAPDQQQNLKQNLSLKVQLAQWAASEQKEAVYQQTLLDIQQWLNEFFDMELPANQRFYQSIEKLKEHTIYYDYPSDLKSSTAMKRLLDNAKSNSYNQVIDKINAPAEDSKKALKKNDEQQELSIDNENVDGGQL